MKEACRHQHLVLLPSEKQRLQCRRCHLTITADELHGRYCPECHANTGKRYYDFQEIPARNEDACRYQCEHCGVIITVE